jgi:hypothetical protein
MNVVFSLGSCSSYLIVYMQILQNLGGKKIPNLKDFWSQAFQIRDSKPVLPVTFLHYLMKTASQGCDCGVSR